MAREAEGELAGVYRKIDERAERLTEKVLDAFREERVSEAMFAPTTGYGYGDTGRDAVDRIAARVFGGEAGFMRSQFICGTHAITVALFGLLRPGDVMLSVTGTPYDTLRDTIGIGEAIPGEGSLRDFGVEYAEIGLDKDGHIDLRGLRECINKYGRRIKVVFIQRSKGYYDRRTLCAEEIGEAARLVKSLLPGEVYVTVDNCYGEFTQDFEPAHTGADIIIGSLIKNPGGGMADTGGYIVGCEKGVRLCANRLCCPGVGIEQGASLGQNRNMLKGLFYAPHTVAQALKTAHLAAYMFSSMGYEVSPSPFEERYDIIQTVRLGSREGLISFCRGIQSASPIDAHVSPEPWAMPGYGEDVIMAAGAFTGGASIELSADGPMREPYIAFMQGGLTYESARLGVISAAAACDMMKK